jgi:5-methylthioribose kinase
MDINGSYHVLDEAGIASWLATHRTLAQMLGGTPASWQIIEVSDGNMNRVFMVTGCVGALAVKQALPYIRAVPDWSFPAERIDYEAKATRAFGIALPGSAPELLHHDPVMKIMVMEALTHHRVWRDALVAGDIHSGTPYQLGRNLAKLHHAGSMEALGIQGFREAMAAFGTNPKLVATAAEVIFTGPYGDHPLNSWNRPRLDRLVADIRGNGALKSALALLKHHFLTRAETLIHGDLHTGSVMVSAAPQDKLRPCIIDAEWAFHGPTAFDVGALIGNLLLAACAQPGHERRRGDRADSVAYCWSAADQFWQAYHDDRLRFLDDREDDYLMPHHYEGDAGARRAFHQARLRDVWQMALGFAGAKMLRRLIGISHVKDFTAIADDERRAKCETDALHLAVKLVLGAGKIDNIGQLRELHTRRA